MSKNKKTNNKNQKKSWAELPKKKKIGIIVLSSIAALLILIIIAGAIALNWYCKTADYEIIETTQPVTLIAHRGMRSLAPENTVPSFEEAGNHSYWGAECDIYRTADGVWVVSHDPNTFRMMDKTANIEKKTYAELMEMTVDNGSNIDNYPDLKICTLEEYLAVCTDNSMVAVIELKSKNNTEYYEELVDIVSSFNVGTIYISFHIENLEAIRQYTNTQLYYLVQEISDEDIELAKSIPNCGIDFNGNKEKNIENGMIQKCIDEGLSVAAWTIDDIDTLNKLYENGVTIITTDNIYNPAPGTVYEESPESEAE